MFTNYSKFIYLPKELNSNKEFYFLIFFADPNFTWFFRKLHKKYYYHNKVIYYI